MAAIKDQKAIHDRFNPSEVIQDRFYEGERPLYGLTNTVIEKVRFYPGESPLKHTRQLALRDCEFMGKYPLWHSTDIDIVGGRFTIYARAAIWYASKIRMEDVQIDAPKMFRQVQDLTLERCAFTNAQETLWSCTGVALKDVKLQGADYLFMNGRDISLEAVDLQGNYAFQDAKNVVIRNARLDSRDAFWGTDHVTVYDSLLEGEFLGWYSNKLRLINCTIRGTQPLCYAANLELVHCRMEETDLCFEYSTLKASIDGHIQSIKNPDGGSIRAQSIGSVIIDGHCHHPGACEIVVNRSISEHVSAE